MIPLLLALAVADPACKTFQLPQAGETTFCLWDGGDVTASQPAGPPAPSPDPGAAPVTVGLADRVAGHAFRIGIGAAADSWGTAYALWRAPETLAEKNPAGFSAEARIALKVGTATAALGVCWKLERDGHSLAARIVSWTMMVAQFLYAAWDIHLGIVHHVP